MEIVHRLSDIAAQIAAGEIGPCWWLSAKPNTRTVIPLFRFPKKDGTATAQSCDPGESSQFLLRYAGDIFTTNPQAKLFIEVADKTNVGQDNRFGYTLVADNYTGQQPNAYGLQYGYGGLNGMGGPAGGMQLPQNLQIYNKSQVDDMLTNVRREMEMKIELERMKWLMDLDRQRLKEEKDELEELRKKYESNKEAIGEVLNDSVTPLAKYLGRWAKENMGPGAATGGEQLAGTEDPFITEMSQIINPESLTHEQKLLLAEQIQDTLERIQGAGNDQRSTQHAGRFTNHSRQANDPADNEAG